MEQRSVDRRRGRRVSVEAPVIIRRGDTKHVVAEENTKNLSLGGAYFETNASNLYQVNDVVLASVAVPESQTQHFPFSRVAGRGRIVRIVESDGTDGDKRIGIAVEFGSGITALTAVPARG